MSPLPMFEEVDCVLCGSKGFDLVLVGEDLIYDMAGEFSLVRCKSCGLLYTNPRPSPGSISMYYPEDYGPHRPIRKQESSMFQSQPEKQRLRKLFSSFITKLIDSGSMELPSIQPPGKILEIGCASGNFLFSMQQKGWETWGIEFAQKPVHYAGEVLGLNVIQGEAERMEFPDETFDLVVAWMVLEHLHNPLEALRRIHATLKRDGYFAFSVPNAGSWEVTFFKKYWYALQLPTHLYHFTPTSIEAILKKAGLKIEKIIFQRCMRNVVASLGLFLFETCGESKIANHLIRYPEQGRWYIQMFLMPLSIVAAFLKQSGRITLWARKL